jgi:hypothetical protein
MGLMMDSDVLMKALVQLAQGQSHNPGYGRKEATLTESTLPTFNGCCGLFDPCGNNDLLSFTVEGEKLLDWIGWKANNECKQFVKMLSYAGPAGTSTGAEATGAIAACAAAPGVEFGTCEVLLPDKGRIARTGPTRDLTENNLKICDTYPTFTKQGEQITDELMWSLTLAGIALKQDLKRMLISGNADTTGHFAGLEALVNTGYIDARFGRACSAMDSYVLNWGNHVASYALNGTHVLVDYLIDIIRRIRTRAAWANLGPIGAGDMILTMPSYLRDAILDTFTFYTIQAGVAYNEVNFANYETRAFRNSLNGGTYGDGQIFVDGLTIPIITYDWHPMTQAAPNFIGDIYVLTRRIGNMPVLWGQYIDMTQPANAFANQAGYAHYKATDGGKFLTYWKTDETCTEATVLMRPNLYLSAPWAQARIVGVAAQRPLAPINPDPTSSYFVEGTLAPAACPEDYLLTSMISR